MHAALAALLKSRSMITAPMLCTQYTVQHSAAMLMEALFPSCCSLDSRLQQQMPAARSYAGKRTRKAKEPLAPKFDGERRVDQQISGPEIRLVGDGVNAVMPLNEAIRSAHSKGLSLVEMATEDKLPVCRIMDYHNFYQKAKQSHDAKMSAHAETAQAVSKIKSIRLGCAPGCQRCRHATSAHAFACKEFNICSKWVACMHLPGHAAFETGCWVFTLCTWYCRAGRAFPCDAHCLLLSASTSWMHSFISDCMQA